MTKRNLFTDIDTGLDALRDQRVGNTLAHGSICCEQAAWLEANQRAVAAYNQRIVAHGPALFPYRSF